MGRNEDRDGSMEGEDMGFEAQFGASMWDRGFRELGMAAGFLHCTHGNRMSHGPRKGEWGEGLGRKERIQVSHGEFEGLLFFGFKAS